jgi:biopolymer transport protein ExbD
MRIPSIAEPEEPQSMSAMTDVVFLLLIFFIVTMSGYVEMTLLETGLPTASGASSAVDLQNSVKIELSASGDCTINGIPQSPEGVARLLRRYQRLMPDAEFLLQCDPDSRHHHLVTLLGKLARHNLKNVKLLKS